MVSLCAHSADTLSPRHSDCDSALSLALHLGSLKIHSVRVRLTGSRGPPSWHCRMRLPWCSRGGGAPLDPYITAGQLYLGNNSVSASGGALVPAQARKAYDGSFLKLAHPAPPYRRRQPPPWRPAPSELIGSCAWLQTRPPAAKPTRIVRENLEGARARRRRRIARDRPLIGRRTSFCRFANMSVKPSMVPLICDTHRPHI